MNEKEMHDAILAIAAYDVKELDSFEKLQAAVGYLKFKEEDIRSQIIRLRTNGKITYPQSDMLMEKLIDVHNSFDRQLEDWSNEFG